MNSLCPLQILNGLGSSKKHQKGIHAGTEMAFISCFNNCVYVLHNQDDHPAVRSLQNLQLHVLFVGTQYLSKTVNLSFKK